MKKICIYFKSEVSGALLDLGAFDGICMKRRKDKLVLERQCLKGGKCKKWADEIPLPQPKKVRKYYELFGEGI
jgi:hypothetical protein